MTNTPGADPIPLDEYEPLLLSTPENFEKYWPLAKPLIEKCIRRAMHGEITIDDIRALAQQQQLYVFVVKYDKTIIPSVKLVVVMDVANYPRLAAMNIFAIAGTDLDYFYRKYWKKLCGWAYMNGVRVLEGWVSPSMERVISRYNFKRAYTLMRYDLTED
jgi:hypothetical protein